MWLLLCFAAIGFSILLGLQFPKDVEWWVAMPLFAGPILVAIIVCAVIQARVDRGRRIGEIELLQSMGLHAQLAEDSEATAAFFAPLSHLEASALLKGGATNIRWFAYGEVGGQYMIAFEHEFVTGSGKSTQVHASTCIGFPSDKGGISFIRPRFGERRAYRKAETAFQIGDSEFDKEWVIWGDSNHAAAIFTPQLLTALSDSPKGEWWCIGGGWECCVTKVALDHKNLAKFIAHVNGIARLI
jgi:hypothetical protein